MSFLDSYKSGSGSLDSKQVLLRPPVDLVNLVKEREHRASRKGET